MQKNKLITSFLIAIVVGAGAFYGGMTYAQSNMSLQTNALQQGGISAQQQSGVTSRVRSSATSTSNPLISGQIIGKDADSVTIKFTNNNSQFILYTPTTLILKTLPGTINDLSNGLNIVASGTLNSDGSLAAQTIQIRPAGETAGMSSTQQVKSS